MEDPTPDEIQELEDSLTYLRENNFADRFASDTIAEAKRQNDTNTQGGGWLTSIKNAWRKTREYFSSTGSGGSSVGPVLQAKEEIEILSRYDMLDNVLGMPTKVDLIRESEPCAPLRKKLREEEKIIQDLTKSIESQRKQKMSQKATIIEELKRKTEAQRQLITAAHDRFDSKGWLWSWVGFKR